MRTTVDLEEETLRRAKTLAAEKGMTLSRLVEDAVKAVVNRGPAAAGARVELPVFHGGRLRPGIDLSDSAGLAELMDADEAR
ncbi:MAG TPA: CopG family transcriptional regulator [Mycobacteriales bacterium]|nr:CopG family transcriptional regulator [Mycobacteriales bacterium]